MSTHRIPDRASMDSHEVETPPIYRWADTPSLKLKGVFLTHAMVLSFMLGGLALISYAPGYASLVAWASMPLAMYAAARLQDWRYEKAHNALLVEDASNSGWAKGYRQAISDRLDADMVETLQRTENGRQLRLALSDIPRDDNGDAALRREAQEAAAYNDEKRA